MKDLIKYLPMLKAAASKENYPMYAQYMCADDGKVRTCNSQSYVEIQQEMPFEGNVNLFVLETILKTLPDEYRIDKEHGIMRILAKGLNYKLTLSDVDVPKMEEPSTEGTLNIDEGILEILKIAQRFTGSFEYEPIYVDGQGIVATDQDKLLIYNQQFSLTKPIILTKQIINILDIGHYIGAEPNDNTVITFPEGFAIFVTPHFSSYPADQIRPYAEKELTDTLKLCSVGDFKTLISKVMPIFFGEAKRLITVENYDGIVEVTGESPFNGKAKAQTSSNVDFEWTTFIDADLFSAVPDTYDIYIKEDSKNIMAKNHVADVILIGH